MKLDLETDCSVNTIETPAQAPLNPNIVFPTDARWYECLEELSVAPRFAYDMETYDVKPWEQQQEENKRRKRWKNDALNPWKGKPRLIQVGLPSGLTMILDAGGREVAGGQLLPSHPNLPQAYVDFYSTLRVALNNPRQQVVGVNLKFDQVYTLVHLGAGYYIRGVEDLMLMSQVLWAGAGTKGCVERLSHGMKGIASRFGITVSKEEQLSDWGGTLTNSQYNYAAQDVQVVFQIHDKITLKLIVDRLVLNAQIENGAAPAFAEMEYRGMAIDEKQLDHVIEVYQAAQAEALAAFHAHFPDVDPAKVQYQLLPALKERYGIEETGDEFLADIKDKPGIAELRLWRSICKPLEYAVAVKNKHLLSGRVRSDFRQLGPQGTGRSTSSNPNLQNPANLPPDLKKLGLPALRTIFRVPEGRKLIISDLSQAHQRICTEFSQDPALLAVYNAGKDPHCLTAATLAKTKDLDWSDTEIDEWRNDKDHPNQTQADKLRKISKTVNYASLNQVGKARLQGGLKEEGIEVTLDEAGEAITAWRTTYNVLYKFIQDKHRESNTYNVTFEGIEGVYGEIRGLSGRRSYFRKWPSKFRKSAPDQTPLTDVTSFLWLSTEADIVKLAMWLIQLEFDAHPQWNAWIVNMAHDELNVECDEEFALEVATIVQHYMDGAMARWLHTIPVNEPGANPAKSIADSWAQK